MASRPWPASRWTHGAIHSEAFFRTVATLGVQAAEALEYAHQMGVVHRDVKPANLLLDHGGHLWVTDFGLARFQDCPSLTTPGDLVGTLRYLSPEQAAGQPILDPRSDVHALGATLYELLTQQPAVPGRDRRECLQQILHEEPTPPRRLNRAIPRCSKPSSSRRWPGCPRTATPPPGTSPEDLRRFLADQPIRARPPGLLERSARWARRHRRLVAAGVLGLVAAVVVLGVTTWRISQAEGRALAACAAVQDEKARTQSALDQEVIQRNRAEGNYRQARKALDVLTRLGVEEPGRPPRTPGTASPTALRAGRLLQGVHRRPHRRRAREIDELIQTRLQLAELLDEVGRRAESLAAFEQAVRDSERLPADPRPAPPFSDRSARRAASRRSSCSPSRRCRKT